ncbi:MAG: adenylosuccinate lyase [Bacteroidetes bacterium]|nr:MAG: adenylosuccinate lyase [Bacteroidota bacterium]
MNLTQLSAVSPVDGRYRKAIENLSWYFSEAALINFRIFVEVEYFIALCKLPLPQLSGFKHGNFKDLREICNNFSFEEAERVKEIEKVTNHDVKAVEYYLKEEFDRLDFGEFKEFLHFGLTSQDITNTAAPYALKLACKDILFPDIELIIEKLSSLAKEWGNIPMLARTHGQPASPTVLGKEIAVFTERLQQQFKLLKELPFTAKFGGATGNFNAHQIAYPDIDWVSFANKFHESMGLQRQQTTTQIEHYDFLAAFFDNMKRINTILIDLNRDIWAYISMDYFKQTIKKGEVGSSTMPHKVNPIDFENSEGNLGYANAIFTHLSGKLPVSRLQRDLTDSTVARNIGVPVAHSIIAYKSLLKGLGKLILNEDKIQKDLEANWAVVGEAIQTILRREGFPKPYEKLKDLTRLNTTVNADSIRIFVESLEVSDSVKKELLLITPSNYTGIKMV